MCLQSLDREDPLEEEMTTYSSILAGETHGQRSLRGFSPWGRRVTMTEHACSHSWLPKIRRPVSQERDWRRQMRVSAVRKEGRDWIQCMF